MKRLFTFVVLFSTLTLSAYAQSDYSSDYDNDESAVSQSEASAEIQPNANKTNNSSFRDHWTIGLKGGINYFTLTPEQESPQKGNNGKNFGVFSDISQQFAIFTEYSFAYGLGAGAYFGNYSFNRYAVLGSSLEFGAYFHLNLIENFVWKNAPAIARRFRVYWDLGLGASALWQNNQIAGDFSSDSVKWGAVAVLRTALQFEFLVRPNWGILLEGEYHGYGRPLSIQKDNFFHSSPWINAGMINLGMRYYFDKSVKERDPRLDENGLPIHKPKKTHPTPKNAVYVNVNLTPETIEEAMRNNGNITIRASELGSDAPASAQVSPMRQSNDINNALSTLAEQGVGTVLINSIEFDNNQLTDGSMDVLDEIAGSLMSNQLWQKVELLYMSDKQASEKASLIATYLRAKGVKNLSVKGVTAQSEGDTSDLIISIK